MLYEVTTDMAYLKENLSMFTNLTKEYLDSIPSCITDTIALSTMHGCKREEIEKIAEYLLCEKQLNVYVVITSYSIHYTKLYETAVRTN